MTCVQPASGARTGPRRRRRDRPPARRQSRLSQQHGDSDNDHKTTTPDARQSPARQPSTAPKLTPRFRKAEASERLGCGGPWLLLLVGNPPERQSAAEFSIGDKAAVALGPETAVSRPDGSVRTASICLPPTGSSAPIAARVSRGTSRATPTEDGASTRSPTAESLFRSRWPRRPSHQEGDAATRGGTECPRIT